MQLGPGASVKTESGTGERRTPPERDFNVLRDKETAVLQSTISSIPPARKSQLCRQDIGAKLKQVSLLAGSL